MAEMSRRKGEGEARARTQTPSWTAAVPELELRERRARLTCSYCRGSLEQRVHICPGCGSLLHGPCRDELGRCPTLGCAWAARGEEGIELPVGQLTGQAQEKRWEPIVASLCGAAMAFGGGWMAWQLLHHRVTLVEGAFWGVFCIGLILIGGITALNEAYRVCETLIRGGPAPRRRSIYDVARGEGDG